jgi:hypothetical protein
MHGDGRVDRAEFNSHLIGGNHESLIVTKCALCLPLGMRIF